MIIVSVLVAGTVVDWWLCCSKYYYSNCPEGSFLWWWFQNVDVEVLAFPSHAWQGPG